MAAAKRTMPVDVAGLHRPAGTLDTVTALRPYDGRLGERLAAHLLRRAGFGGTQDEIRRYAAMKASDAVASLVNFPSTDALPQPDDLVAPSALDAALQSRGVRALKSLDTNARRDVLKDVRKEERRSIVALQLWWLDRMLRTPAPLQEKMTLYFHGHFTTAAMQKGVYPSMAYNQNELFRSGALGNLRRLTFAVSQDPAMLLYLDNAGSSKAKPNENYARELMELFTLGVDNYTEQDVREGARAWTGYVVNRRTGQAYFDPRRHDNGTKHYLGRTGNFAGADVVETIFDQPQCAKFFASSLLNHFVYNDPEPALVQAVADLLWNNSYELKPVMSTLLASNVFFSDRAYRALVKSPAEFVVGAYKALAIPQIERSALPAMRAMGQTLFYPPNVAGWPGGANWMTSQMLISRQNFAAQLVNAHAMGDSSIVLTAPQDAEAASKALADAILQGDASPSSYAQLVAYLDGANTSALAMLSMENREVRLRGAAYLTMSMPAFQLN